MKTTICCENTKHNEHTFYLTHNGKRYYLFRQRFYSGVHEFFKSNINIRQALDRSRARRDTAILRTMEKIPKYITYIEHEYGIKVS